MSLPAWLRDVLPADTSRCWERLREIVPPPAYLVGGTAIAVHLRHRRSRDLDFFLSEPVDLDALRRDLEAAGRFAVNDHQDDTLNGVFEATRVQFLLADTQRMVEPPTLVEGIAVAGLGDLLASKLKVIGDRGELRDYFDVKVIEERGGKSVEEGMRLFLARYQPKSPTSAVAHLIRGLGYFGDVPDDPGLPESRDKILRYWERRVPEVAMRLAVIGGGLVPSRAASPPAPRTAGPRSPPQVVTATVRCRRCGAVLRSPKSRETGMGPRCARR